MTPMSAERFLDRLEQTGLLEHWFLQTLREQAVRKMDSILQGHPDMRKTPGIDMTAGSLGHGLSVGLGMALSGKLRKKTYHVWVVVGDGETQEGSVWEAAMAAPKWKLDNLTAILDRNRLQNDACVADVMPIEPLPDKWRAFGWNVVEIDGHDMEQVVGSLEGAKTNKGAPTMIIAHTVKGKGVSYMENIVEWHGKAPCKEEAECALEEIRRCACEL
jgi:transketolase